MKSDKLMDVYREVWKKYSVPIKKGKLDPYKESFVWYGRDWIDRSNPPFLAAVFKVPSILWEPIQTIQADLERIDARQRYHCPNYFHVTLEEYGWEDQVNAREIIKIMKKILPGYSPFEIQLRGLNCFSRTVFIQVFDKSQNLRRMYKDIHTEFPNLTEEHFQYVPHVSIVDILTNEARDLMTVIKNTYREKTIGEVTVDTIHIVKARPYLSVGRIETIEIIPLGNESCSKRP
jgi:2'-5' RNA ligase